jgi:hypothetical protein
MLKIDWDPEPRKLREFGLTMIIGSALLGGLLYWKDHHTAAYWVWGVGAVLGFLGYEAPPPMALPFYRLWMGIGFVIGSVTSRIMLTVIFFAVITPVALIFKLMKRDTLRLRRAPDGESYWVNHPRITDKNYYRHLF